MIILIFFIIRETHIFIWTIPTLLNILAKIFGIYHFNLDLTRIDEWVIVLIKNIFLIVISTFFIIVLLKTNNLSNENLNKDNTPSNFNNNDGV
ncbi:hypothetical protein LQ356_00190 [Metamycoplasma faucium]|uniref:Uncharacterized protein n=1 Tax=Metamycoplasma faucium TaxID=56142 RepID=A0ABZ2TQ66_9BACT